MMLAVYAMARPRRPDAEREAVLSAPAGDGSAAQRARTLARAVVSAAVQDMDQDPGDRLVSLLMPLSVTPIARLATDPEIGTAGLIVRERMRRMEARGGRRLQEWEWCREDREIAATVTAVLAERYARLMRVKKSPQQPVFSRLAKGKVIERRNTNEDDHHP
jgi:hypothetical protein